MTVLFRFTCLALSIAVQPFAACNERTDAQRCEELGILLENRIREATSECVGDEDCEVVWMRPDQPVAVSVPPSDAQLQRVVREFSDRCAARVYGDSFDSLPVASGNLTAVCQPQLQDDFNAEGSAIERVTGRQCVMRGEVIRPEPVDAGADSVTDGSAFCACTSDTTCGGSERCIDCACFPDSLCAQACQRAVACDALDALNLGASPATCIALCEDSSSAGPTDGATDGSTEGSTDGATDGSSEGSKEGSSNGSTGQETNGGLANCILQSECTDLLRCRR
jgi:hypothetical protein